MMYILYLFCILLPASHIRCAADQTKQLSDYFDICNVWVPGKEIFHATCFVVQKERGFFEPTEEIIVRAAIVSGPDAGFVGSFAQEAQRMKLQPLHRRSHDATQDLKEDICKKLVGEDLSKIKIAKQTSIALIRGTYPNRALDDILVPAELSEYLNDLHYCSLSDDSPEEKCKALRRYLSFLRVDSANRYAAPVLIPKK